VSGLLLDVPGGTHRHLAALAGTLVAFSADGTSILVAKHHSPRGGASSIAAVDLTGQVLREYPLSMTVPEIIEPSADGGSLTVTGMAGNPLLRAPRMCTAVQTVNLNTSQSNTQKGPVTRGYPRDRRKPKLDKMPVCDRQATSDQWTRALCWDEASGICVVKGAGMPEGGTVQAWDVRAGEYLRTVDTQNDVRDVGGFLRPGVIVANAWHGAPDRREQLMTIIDLRTNRRTPTRARGRKFHPCPDGQHVAVVTGDEHSASGPLELWHVQGAQPILTMGQASHYSPFCWTDKGTTIVRLASGRKGNRFVEIRPVHTPRAVTQFAPARRLPVKPSVTEKQFKMAERTGIGREEYLRIKTRELAEKAREDALIWRMDTDPAFRRLAMGTGSAKQGRVVVVEVETKQEVAELGGFSGWVNALRFVDAQCILAGDIKGNVKFWNLAENRVLWTINTGDTLVQFAYVPGARFLVCQHTFGGAAIVHMEDGTISRRTPNLVAGGSFSKRSWTNPYPIGDGSVALEIERHIFQLNLVAIHSGKRLLSFCPFPKGEWIVYSPDAYWTGSPHALAWARFYRGCRLVDEDEAARLRQADKIKAVLRAAFR